MKLERFLYHVTDILDGPMQWVAMGGMVISTLLAFIEVITRYLFGISHAWAQEISIYVIIYAVFLFGGPALKRGDHIRVDFLSNILRGRARLIHAVVVDLALTALCVFLFVTGIGLVRLNYDLGTRTGSQAFLIYPFLVAVPLGMLIFSLYSFVHLLGSVVAFSRPLKEVQSPSQTAVDKTL